jgi:hypothetical protein
MFHYFISSASVLRGVWATESPVLPFTFKPLRASFRELKSIASSSSSSDSYFLNPLRTFFSSSPCSMSSVSSPPKNSGRMAGSASKYNYSKSSLRNVTFSAVSGCTCSAIRFQIVSNSIGVFTK